MKNLNNINWLAAVVVVLGCGVATRVVRTGLDAAGKLDLGCTMARGLFPDFGPLAAFCREVQDSLDELADYDRPEGERMAFQRLGVLMTQAESPSLARLYAETQTPTVSLTAAIVLSCAERGVRCEQEARLALGKR